MKFQIAQKEYIIRNIQFTKEQFTKINKIKGDISLNKFIIQAVKYTLKTLEDK